MYMLFVLEKEYIDVHNSEPYWSDDSIIHFHSLSHIQERDDLTSVFPIAP